MSEIDKTQTFVVGTGLNEGGSVAVRTGYELWRRMEGIELHVIYALDRHDKDIAALDLEMDEAMAKLRDHVTACIEGLDLSDAGHIQPIGHVRIGKPVEVIDQMAIDVEADLIIVGAQARKGLGSRLLGSTSDELTRNAHAPVMVARKKDYSGVRHSSSVLPPRPDQGDIHSRAPHSTRTFQGASRSSHLPGMI